MSNYRAHHTTDSIGRSLIIEEYIGNEKIDHHRRRMLPGTSDADAVVSTKKHGDITLGKLAVQDPEYLKWLVVKSKQTKTIKYAAIRVMAGVPYQIPWDGEEYEHSRFFDYVTFGEYIKRLNIQI